MSVLKDIVANIESCAREECERFDGLSMERDKLLDVYRSLGGKTPTCKMCDESCVPTLQLKCCGAFSHIKCPNVELGIIDWIENSSSCPFCHNNLSEEDLEKIRDYYDQSTLVDKLHNKDTKKIFEIYHNMICENEELKREIEFLDSFIKAHELVTKNTSRTSSASSASWMSGSSNNRMCNHISAKVKEEPIPKISAETISAGGGSMKKAKQPCFIDKIRSLEQLILRKYKGRRICPKTLIEFIYSNLTDEIELLGNLTQTNQEAESVLLLIITVCLNWEKEREEIDIICAKGNISEDDIQRIFDNEFENLFDDEDDDYATMLATIKIAIAIQLLKPVDEEEKINEEYLEKRRVLVSEMRDFELVSNIISLIDDMDMP